MRIFQYRISANDPEISDPGDREHSLCSEDFSERILLSQLPLYLDERARRTDFAPLAYDFPGDQPVPRRVTSAGRDRHEVALCIVTGAGNFWWRRLLQLQRSVQTGDCRPKGTACRNSFDSCARPEPAGISGSGEIKAGRQTGRGAQRPLRLHPEISQWPALRGSERPARRYQHRYTFLARALPRKTGIHRKKRGRHCASRAEDEIDAGANHAHQQHERHHAPHRRKIADLESRFFDAHSDETENYCTDQPWAVFQAIPCPGIETAGEAALAYQH